MPTMSSGTEVVPTMEVVTSAMRSRTKPTLPRGPTMYRTTEVAAQVVPR